MIISHLRGHEIYFDEENSAWRYSDNNQIAKDSRPCKRCGKFPTKEGYDSCLGYVPGATSACCGHGVNKPIREYGGKSKEFAEWIQRES